MARRDIVVSAQASGTVQPDTVVEVKSKASGEILEIRVETGQAVKRGDLLVRVDPRTPRNVLAQAQADLEVARGAARQRHARRSGAPTSCSSPSPSPSRSTRTPCSTANARAEVVRAQVAVENAQIQMDDTDVRAPISGTIIEKRWSAAR